MDRVAVFVDAGYFFAQGSALLSGKKTPRGELTLDLDKLLAALEEFSSKISRHPLLRIYWYDGTSTGPTPQHVTLAFKPNVKVRLGIVNTAGQQKGVDSLIVTDLITLARNRAMSDAVLLSGDEDVRVGVQQAQEIGVRVHLLGVSPCRGSQSLLLMQEADTTHEWGKKEISTFLTHNQRSIQPVAAMPETPVAQPITLPLTVVSPEALDNLAKEAANEMDQNVIEGLIKNFESAERLPPDVDRPLIGRAKRSFGMLDPKQLAELRQAFVAALKLRLPPKPDPESAA
jgi:uncharacterized LabA/DUF88 family protein